VTLTSTDDAVVTCPGCGGRNPAGSSECDWCGRPFISKGGRLRLTVWQVLSSLFLLGLIGAVAALAYLNAGRNLPPVRVGAQSTSTASLPTAVPTLAVTPRVTTPLAPTPTTAPAVNEPTPAPQPTEVATPEPTPTPQLQAARISNTGGQGVSVRTEPGPQAARAGVLREGTRVLLTGNDQTVAARQWREVRSEDGSLTGWVLADFLQLSAP
jgi:hypothetical protein